MAPREHSSEPQIKGGDLRENLQISQRVVAAVEVPILPSRVAGIAKKVNPPNSVVDIKKVRPLVMADAITVPRIPRLRTPSRDFCRNSGAIGVAGITERAEIRENGIPPQKLSSDVLIHSSPKGSSAISLSICAFISPKN